MTITVMCPNARWTGRHRFEARFDEAMPAGMFDGNVSLAGLGIVDRLKSRTYVRDICVRCGQTVERER